MAEAATETRQQLELTRQSLEDNVDRLMTRARAELDWKARLRRDLPQILAIGGGIIVIGVAATVLKRRLRPKREGLTVDDYSTIDLGDVAKELRAMRKELEKVRDESGGPLVKLATGALTAAATVAGRVAAGRLADQSLADTGAEPTAAG